MEDNITEKFALLNLIQALQGLSGVNNPPAEENNEAPPPPKQPESEVYNPMANVLARHEEIANRIRNKPKT